MVGNYRKGWERPQWHGGGPGRNLTEYEEKVWKEAPFMNTQTGYEIKPTDSQLGYSLTGMEEEGPSAEKPLSDKYLKIHNMKYQPMALRPRFYKKAFASYHRVYPAGKKLPEPSTMEEAGRTTCVFYPDQPNLLLKAPLHIADPQDSKQRNDEGRQDPNDNNPLLQFLRSYPTFSEKILNEAGYLAVASFAQSCKLGMQTVSEMICLFDLATGDFANTEYNQLEYEMLSSNGEVAKEEVPHGYKVLQVAPCYLGFDPKTGYQKRPSYEKLSQGTVRLSRSFRLWGSSIRHLYLTKVPFMDVMTLGMWLQDIPKLETLTVLRCEHIRMFDLVPLVELVHDHHEKSGSKLMLDVAPFYELGPRNANFKGDSIALEDHLRPSTERKGTFGVTFADPGVKIPAAVVEFLFYELLPKLQATDQMHLMSLDSLLRRFFERLPMPRGSILRTIKAYEGVRKWFKKVDSYMNAIAPQDTSVFAFQLAYQTGMLPEFPDPAGLPQQLRQEEAWERIRCYVLLAYAAFGDEHPHLQTAADSAWSSNAPIRPYNFGRWGEDLNCLRCGIRMPSMFFPTAFLCDKDRLQDACAVETDHLRLRKQGAMRRLGAGRIPQQCGALEQTNIDFSKLYDANGVSRLRSHQDFDSILAAPDSMLRGFYLVARNMDTWDPTGLKGRLQHKQRVHPHDCEHTATGTRDDAINSINYRKGRTVEDFTKYKGGMHPGNMIGESQY